MGGEGHEGLWFVCGGVDMGRAISRPISVGRISEDGIHVVVIVCGELLPLLEGQQSLLMVGCSLLEDASCPVGELFGVEVAAGVSWVGVEPVFFGCEPRTDCPELNVLVVIVKKSS